MTRDEATKDEALRVALDGRRARKSLREIAEDLYGVATVAGDWDADSWTRARSRRVVRKARAAAEGDGRDGAAGERANG